MGQEADLSEFDHHDEIADLRALVKSLQTKLRKAKHGKADIVEAVFAGSRDAAITLGNPPPVPSPTTDKRKVQEEVALLHLSDWQIGKETASYNSQVALERIERITDKVLQITEIERSHHPVRRLDVMLGGDMVEGTNIFPLQAWEIDSTTFEQVETASLALKNMFRRYLASFETIHVWQEEGNHGRPGRKNENPAEDNWDLVTYKFAQDWFEAQSEKRIIWHPRQSFYQLCKIGNYTALLIHGDEINMYGGQLPTYGIAKRVNGWAADVIDHFDDCYMGHFHTPYTIPLANQKRRVFLNPSLESDSVYAQAFMAASGYPSQRLHFIDPDVGRVTSERLLYVD